MALAAIIDDALDEFIERMANAGTAVVDARQIRMFPEIEDDVDYIVDVDEVAYLAAVFIACRPFKEGNLPFSWSSWYFW